MTMIMARSASSAQMEVAAASLAGDNVNVDGYDAEDYISLAWFVFEHLAS